MTRSTSKRAGPRRVTISEVAAQAGVARATAAFVINGRATEMRISRQTTERVREAASRLGYVPSQIARGMITGRSQVIGVILGGVWGKFGQYAIEGIREVLEQRQYLPLLSIHSWDEDRERQELDTLLRMRADGVIAMPQRTSRRECYEPFFRQRVPLVFFGDVPFDIDAARVAAWDPREAMRTLVGHLAALGCHRIGLVGERFFRMTAQRYVAYRQTLAEFGFEHDPAWETWAEVGDGADAAAEDWAGRFQALPRKPDALVAINDNCGLRMLHALRAAGVRVPEDVRLGCLGDTIETVEQSAELTAIREPVREIGRVAAELVIEAIESPDAVPRERLVSTAELVVRRSTAGGGH